MRDLESVISGQGFCVDTRLWKRQESGHWVTTHPGYVVIDDVATPGRGIATPAIHPLFTETSNNAVFHSLPEVTNVLTQLQVCLRPALYLLGLGKESSWSPLYCKDVYCHVFTARQHSLLCRALY